MTGLFNSHGHHALVTMLHELRTEGTLEESSRPYCQVYILNGRHMPLQDVQPLGSPPFSSLVSRVLLNVHFWRVP